MKETNRITFNGFSPGTLKFLKDVAAKNSKSWFEEHRQEFEDYLMTPMRALVMELSGPMMTIDPELETRPVVNKTISRIYRDTRFSKDKSLFRSNMWITFKRPIRDWKEAPAFYFDISPDAYHYGMGFYSASPDTMKNLRGTIDTRPDSFRKMVAFYKKRGPYTIGGEQYRRVFNESVPTDLKPWYQQRNLYIYCGRKINQRLFSRKLVSELTSAFYTLAPLYHFFLQIKAEN
ncbi:MAG: DUF2461 domain-containing protein [Candidatus Zixiibacteriota bacterium]|nr:MAG: DUF2461 domain-containing protein [candidate division Zixibacteria bacterium]